eukprot:4414222-Amphidinium_carterae.1
MLLQHKSMLVTLACACNAPWLLPCRTKASTQHEASERGLRRETLDAGHTSLADAGSQNKVFVNLNSAEVHLKVSVRQCAQRTTVLGLAARAT